MPKIVVPSNLDTRLYNTLRNMANALEETGANIPLLKTLAQVRNIPNETSAYLIERGTLYRYTKIDNKLFREEVDDTVEPPPNYGTVLGDPVRTMPIDVTDPVIITDDPIDTDPTDPTEITISDIIDDSVGDLRVNLLEVREVAVNNDETIPIIFLTIDGKLYYCAQGTYFNKYLNLDVTIGDDTTDRETQRPTVSFDVPSNHSNEPFTATIPFSRAVNGFTQDKIQVTGATLRDFSGNGRIYKVVVVPTGTSDVRLLIPANIVTDKYLLHNIASDRVTVSYQTEATRPAMSIFAPASYQGTSSFQIRMRSSEVVSGFTASDPVLVGATLGNFQATGMTNTVYTADVTPTGTGIITIDIPENAAQDSNGNRSTAARQVRIVTVPSIPRSLAASASDGEITVRWTASASANGSPILWYEVRVDTEDWINVGRNLAYTFTGLTNSQTYNVQVRAVNDVGYSNVASINAQPNATDNTRPILMITAPRTYEGTSTFPIGVSASEVIHNLTASDITVVGGTASNRQGQDDAYTFDITPTGTGTIQISIRANAAQDGANNGNLATGVVSVTYKAAATPPNPARGLVLTARDKEISAVWRESESDGGAPIQNYEIQLDTGNWIEIGTRLDYTFRNLTNDRTYTVNLRVRNRVGVSTSISARATPEAADAGSNVMHRLVIDFDNDIIGDPAEERRFWAQQGMHSTCAAVAVGAALHSLGILDDGLQVVRDATMITDAATGDPLGPVVLNVDGDPVRNEPTILIRGEGIYTQPSTRLANGRYRLGHINWNFNVYPFGRLRARFHTKEERLAYSGWNGVNVLVDHYNVDYHVGYAYDFSWLIRELEAGNKVIAFVDAYEIWGEASLIQSAQVISDRIPIQDGNDLNVAQTNSVQNHAVWITGIDLSDPSQPQIYINDSGNEGHKYSFAQFMASWEDAEFIYTAIGSDELPDTPTIDGAELNREHRELQRILRLHRADLFDIAGVQIYPFFDYRFQQDFLRMIGIQDRYNAYVKHIAQEQQRITDAYGLDANTFKNVLDVLQNE